jgi:hypothetical protein
MQESPLEGRLMRVAEESFGNACKALAVAAQLNHSAASAVLEPGIFDHSDEAEEGRFAPTAIAYGIAQLAQLHRQLLLLAIGMEMAAAEAEVLAEG